MSPYRVVLADHHAMLRESIGKMLSEIIDLQVEGEVATVRSFFPLSTAAIQTCSFWTSPCLTLAGLRSRRRSKCSILK